jgi:hypothetical protein
MTPYRSLAFALLWLLHLPAFAAIGTIDSLEGDVRVVSASSDRPGAAGAEINEGDTVKTGDNAWALLTMTDGASFTLRPNSQLRFQAYRYNPDGNASDNSSVLALVKGALRSITGYIGRTNRAGYKIETPTAMIGIRGTDHEPAHYPPGEYADRDPGTYDKVNDGESFIRHPKGELSVKAGQYAFVHHNARVAPRILQRPPAFYQRYAGFDKKAAARRQDFHRKFEEQYQRRAQERAQRPQQREHEKQQLREKEKPGRLQQREPQDKQKRERLEKQQQQRELSEKRQQERQALQEQRRQKREEEKLKRQQERAKKQEKKQEHEKRGAPG